MKVSTLLRVKKNWCQHTSARNASGIAVEVDSSSAKSFCLIGAIRRCYGSTGPENRRAVGRIRQAIRVFAGGPCLIAEFNDSPVTTFSQIKKVIKLAKI
jgi:hypothetical protein